MSTGPVGAAGLGVAAGVGYLMVFIVKTAVEGLVVGAKLLLTVLWAVGVAVIAGYRFVRLHGTADESTFSDLARPLMAPIMSVIWGREPRAAVLGRPATPSAPQFEKTFARAIRAWAEGDLPTALALLKQSSAEDGADASYADDLLAGVLSYQLADFQGALPYLERARRTQSDADELLHKYAPGAITIALAEFVAVDVPFGRFSLTLVYADTCDKLGRRPEALDALQMAWNDLSDSNSAPVLYMRLRLCRALVEAEHWQDVLKLTTGQDGEADIPMQLALYRALALEKTDALEAAIHLYQLMLRRKNANAELLRETRYRRGLAYLAVGKKAMARRDLAAVVAEEPEYRDAKQLLNA